MSDPKDQERESDDLDLDAEKIADLEVKDEQGDEVRGGMGCVFSCGDTRA